MIVTSNHVVVVVVVGDSDLHLEVVDKVVEYTNCHAPEDWATDSIMDY